MLNGRLAATDLLLALMALCAVAFGIFGLTLADTPPANTALGPVGEPAGEGGVVRLNPGRAQHGPTDSADTACGPRKGEPNLASETNPATTATDSSATADAELPVTRGRGVIRGKVLRPDGSPAIANVACQPRSAGTSDYGTLEDDYARQRARAIAAWERTERETVRCQSNARGEFVVEGIFQDRTYLVQAECPGFSGMVYDAAPDSSLVIVLSASYTLRGRVTRRDGSPVTAYKLGVAQRGADGVDSQQYNIVAADGSFEICIASPDALVDCSADGLTMERPVPLDAQTIKSPLNIVLDAGGIVETFVSNGDREALSGAYVHFESKVKESASGVWVGVLPLSDSSWIVTDSRGRVRFTLRPGTYSIGVYFSGESFAQDVNVAAGATQSVKAVFETQCKVVLTVLDADGRPARIHGAQFTEVPRLTDIACHPLPPAQPGIYEYVGFKPGEYGVSVQGDNETMAMRNFSVAEKLTKVELRLGQAAYLAGRISGSLPVSTYLCASLAREGAPQSSGGPRGTSYFSANDRFRLGPVEPGRWVFRVTSNSRELFAEVLTLSSGSNEKEVALSLDTWLVVKVVFAEGTATSYLNTLLIASNGSALEAYVDHSTRQVTFGFLEPGEYTFVAENGTALAKRQRVTITKGPNEITVQVARADAALVQSTSSGRSQEGLESGDLIVELNGHAIEGVAGFWKVWRAIAEGANAALVVLRKDQTITVNMKGGAFGYELANARR